MGWGCVGQNRCVMRGLNQGCGAESGELSQPCDLYSDGKELLSFSTCRSSSGVVSE